MTTHVCFAPEATELLHRREMSRRANFHIDGLALEGERGVVGDHKRAADARHLSMVVLPFANIGGDPEQDYFVDGVTESLTTDCVTRLSKVDWAASWQAFD